MELWNYEINVIAIIHYLPMYQNSHQFSRTPPPAPPTVFHFVWEYCRKKK